MEGCIDRVNIGCGQTPTAGWRNFDNSPSIKLARVPMFADALNMLGLIGRPSYEFIQFAINNCIEFADAVVGIPLPDSSVSVIYSSHMLEHLDGAEARKFLAEARRVLKADGIIRVVVPDIGLRVRRYADNGDADEFIQSTLMAFPRPRRFVDRVQAFLYGNRMHNWMYDGASLCKLLVEAGFRDPVVLAAGETTISDPGPLDLKERWDESVYVEARNPK